MSPKQSQPDASGVRFRQVLAEVRRTRAADPEPSEDGFRTRPAHPISGAMASLDAIARSSSGGVSDWDAALAWLEEQDEAVADPAPQRETAATAEAIYEELGLTENLSRRELNRLRRRFMWRNHPDRCGEAQRETATRRVAIANMLIDRAESRLSNSRAA